MSNRTSNNGEPSLLAKMSKQAGEDSEKWFDDCAVVHSIPHHTLALAGEVGEFANLVKKIERGDLRMGDARVRHALAMELTDVLTYVLNLAYLLNIDLAKAYEVKRNENDKRFTEQRRLREQEGA